MSAISTVPVEQDLADAELAQFVETHLPDAGILACFTLPDKKHWPCKTKPELVAQIRKLEALGHTVYHACASYAAEQVDVAGKSRFRVQDNVLAVRAVWADIDCGVEKFALGKGYADQKSGAKAVSSFLAKTKLHVPTVIDSGHGLHMYWPFTEAVLPAHWLRMARKLDTLFKLAGLRVDPSRTCDMASVLRPPGTTNRKNPDMPKKVKCKRQATPIDFDVFESMLDAGLAALAGPVEPGLPPFMTPETSGNLQDFATKDFPPSNACHVADQCQQIKRFSDTGCIDSEPVWHSAIGVVKHCVDGVQKCHEWSTRDPRYDHGETQRKIDSWTTGPTTCAHFKSIDPAGCEGCQQTCTSPIQLGATVPEWLADMNQRYAWIERDAAIFRRQYRDFITMDRFHAAHANQQVELKNGNSVKMVSHSKMFMHAKHRAQFKAIVTRPGEPAVTTDGCLNDWSGFACAPIPGDVGPWLKLFEWLFGQEQYPLHWMAHLIQHPGTKMFVGIVVWSRAEGAGKNLLFETLGALFHQHHYALIGQSEVDDDFCGWIPGSVYVVADEVRATKSDKSRDRLKLWQTSTSLRTHDKGQPKRVVDNLMNLVFLSNHADGMFLSDHDRRYFVHEVASGPLPESLKREFLEWRARGGLQHLLHFLQNVDLADFDPKGRAPITESKRQMVEAGRSDLDRWALDVVTGAIPLGREIVTADEMNGRFLCEYPHIRNPPPVATMARVLVQMGAVRRENQVRLSNGRKVRALALTRTDFWKEQPETAWRAELEKRP